MKRETHNSIGKMLHESGVDLSSFASGLIEAALPPSNTLNPNELSPLSKVNMPLDDKAWWGLREGDTEPLVCYLEALSPNTPLDQTVQNELVRMLKGQSYGAFKLIAVPSSGKRGRQVGERERLARISQKNRALEAFLAADGFKYGRRELGLHAASVALGGNPKPRTISDWIPEWDERIAKRKLMADIVNWGCRRGLDYYTISKLQARAYARFKRAKITPLLE